MVQLSLLGTEAPALAEHVGTLTATWSRKLGNRALADEAAAITRAHFAPWGRRSLTASEQARVSAYFGGVIRRRLMKGNDRDTARARRGLVAASIEADLIQAGWRADRAAAEAMRVLGSSVAVEGAA